MFLGGSWSKCWLTSRELRLFCGRKRRHNRCSHAKWLIVNRPVSIGGGRISLDCSWSRRFPIQPRITYPDLRHCNNSFMPPTSFLYSVLARTALVLSPIPLTHSLLAFHCSFSFLHRVVNISLLVLLDALFFFA